jgi:hypothetical protein
MSVLSATGDAGADVEVGWGSVKVLVSFKVLFVLIVMRIP